MSSSDPPHNDDETSEEELPPYSSVAHRAPVASGEAHSVEPDHGGSARSRCTTWETPSSMRAGLQRGNGDEDWVLTEELSSSQTRVLEPQGSPQPATIPSHHQQTPAQMQHSKDATSFSSQNRSQRQKQRSEAAASAPQTGHFNSQYPLHHHHHHPYASNPSPRPHESAHAPSSTSSPPAKPKPQTNQNITTDLSSQSPTHCQPPRPLRPSISLITSRSRQDADLHLTHARFEGQERKSKRAGLNPEEATTASEGRGGGVDGTVAESSDSEGSVEVVTESPEGSEAVLPKQGWDCSSAVYDEGEDEEWVCIEKEAPVGGERTAETPCCLKDEDEEEFRQAVAGARGRWRRGGLGGGGGMAG